MREIERIVQDVAEIYLESAEQVEEEYLPKARKLKELFGPGLAVVYCWFYSVPQKWTEVEPRIFELSKLTNSFDLEMVLSEPELGLMLKKMKIFYNVISTQLKNFCRAVKNEYGSWDGFVEALEKENIFAIFKRLRVKYKNMRLTFKNLAAMKILVGGNEGLLILDRHVAKVLGLSNDEAIQYRVQENLFQRLLEFSEEITHRLEALGFDGMSTSKWSLAIWFNKAKVQATKLLPNM